MKTTFQLCNVQLGMGNIQSRIINTKLTQMFLPRYFYNSLIKSTLSQPKKQLGHIQILTFVNEVIFNEILESNTRTFECNLQRFALSCLNIFIN